MEVTTAQSQRTVRSRLQHEIGHAYGPSGIPIAGFLHSSMFSCNTWPRRVPLTLTDPTYNDIDCGVRPNEPPATFFPYAYYDFMGGYRRLARGSQNRLAGLMRREEYDRIDAETV